MKKPDICKEVAKVRLIYFSHSQRKIPRQIKKVKKIKTFLKISDICKEVAKVRLIYFSHSQGKTNPMTNNIYKEIEK